MELAAGGAGAGSPHVGVCWYWALAPEALGHLVLDRLRGEFLFQSVLSPPTTMT